MSVDTEMAVILDTEPVALDAPYPEDYEAPTAIPDVPGVDVRLPVELAVRPPEENEAVFIETWQRNRSMLLGVAGRIVGRDRAEDVFQITAERAFAHLDTLSFPSDPESAEACCRALLKRIAINASLDIARRDRRIAFYSLDATDPQTGMSHQEHIDVAAEDAEEMTTGSAVVTRALEKLPPEFRVAVWAVDMEGLTYEESSEVLGVKMGTIRSRLHRARKMLRQIISDGEIEGLEAPKH